MTDLKKLIEQESAKYLSEQVILIGNTRNFLEVLNKAAAYAESDENISIFGEIGTGKTELAKAFHCLGPRRSHPFVYFDCSLLSESLAEEELFGHKRGVFTGAIEDRIGLLEAADGGTFFIDEIGNLPLNLQAKFLRITQDKKIRRIGVNKEIKININLITVTYKDLKAGIKEGWFREDLFSRINVLSIEIPPLRERKADIPELVEFKLFQLNEKYQKNKCLSKDVEKCLLAYSWPCNIRELYNALTKAYFNSEQMIPIESFPEEITNSARAALSDRASISDSRLKNLLSQLFSGEKNFWSDVHEPFLNRDLNRHEVRELIKLAFLSNGMKFKSLSMKFNCNYDKFMGFLRHHNLKPKKMELNL